MPRSAVIWCLFVSEHLLLRYYWANTRAPTALDIAAALEPSGAALEYVIAWRAREVCEHG